MSALHILASEVLIGDPCRRSSAKRPFATGAFRFDQGLLISAIAFGTCAETLLTFRKGAPLAISGPARATECTGRDGAKRHGLSVVANAIIGLPSAPPRAGAPRRAPGRSRESHEPSHSGAQLDDDRLDELFGGDTVR
jgi:hypothetical protein